MVLKSDSTLNYNCSSKKNKYQSTGRLIFEKKKKITGPQTGNKQFFEVSLIAYQILLKVIYSGIYILHFGIRKAKLHVASRGY